ncbi:class I SAM-dependent methyltransferase [Erythrobacter sp. THAF29]|uniref:methyltransferase n=1 Tax=Erythrobacter sp. THAF29 TaxID=2587851 RepID=UPI0012A9B784|nr:class I SAM-dependent methyltransferase [Erythrobacter sp. THAF29]QFT75985.1 ribosomal protein L11 methyltransferase [Erythrobacter sp. THAF29]
MAHPISEHVGYLALPGRYELFEKSISAVVRPGDVVADLGCGVGVLGIQCLEAGASEVYGIDSSEAIHLARETMVRAGLTDRYHCISASTYSTDLPEKVDVLICDHVGHFGFDYGIVDMMRDARTRMLKPGGRIIPDRLSLRIAGVTSEAARSKALAWRQEIIPEPFRWLDEFAANTKYGHEFTPEDLCTQDVAIGEIDLLCDEGDLFSFKATLRAKGDATLDGLGGWFDAHLGGGVWMTNSPLEARSIGRPQAFLPLKNAVEVKEGDEIGVKVRAGADGKLIAWSVEPPRQRGPAQSMSTWASMVLSEGDLTKRSDRPAHLSNDGENARYVLALVDGERTPAEIEQIVLQERPDLRGTRRATREYVQSVLARSTSA